MMLLTCLVFHYLNVAMDIDILEDGIQYKVGEWKLNDMEKYNGKYTIVGFDGSLKIYGEKGEELFAGSLLDSKDFCRNLKEKMK